MSRDVIGPCVSAVAAGAAVAALMLLLPSCKGDDCSDGMRTAPGNACPATTPTPTAGGQR